MAFGLAPWRSPLAKRESGGEDLFSSLQKQMNRVFDDFYRGMDWVPGKAALGRVAAWYPSVNVTEDDKNVMVTAELPGLSEKDIEVSVSKDILTIKGEKREEKEHTGKNVHRMERMFGAFERAIQLPADVETDKIDATFKNGVLTVTLPKTKAAVEEVKKIPVKA